MIKKPTIKSLSADLKYLIERRAEEISKGEESPKNILESLVFELKGSIIQNAKSTNKSFKKEGLTANSIESEGYLRCALMVEQILKNYKLI